MLMANVKEAGKMHITLKHGNWLVYWYETLLGEDISLHDAKLCVWDLYNKSEECIDIIPRSVRKNAEMVWNRAPRAFLFLQ